MTINARVAEPVVQVVSELSPMQFTYKPRYYWLIVRGLLNSGKLDVENSRRIISSSYTISPEVHQRYGELFNVPPALLDSVPFNYVTRSAATWIVRTLGDLGVNFSSLRHVKTAQKFIKPSVPITPWKSQHYWVGMDDIVPMGKNRVVVIFKGAIQDDLGETCTTYEDYFMVGGIKAASMKMLRTHAHLGKSRVSDLASLTRKLPMENYQEAIDFAIPARMGRDYAKLSGDLNIVHIHNAVARLSGHPKAFIQGFCTANYIVKHLSLSVGPITTIETLFARPVYVNEPVRLLCNEKYFSLVSSNSKVLSFGSWS
ncbi:MaoC/PaaZ C-terminal domain-containing protein [Streptomyces bobili]|uniref:MaoC/PaaZ C-terminal domain-containing protein n=1 Tax=Streptomyces bobili TaxID=67280 RepID=UPI0038005ABD